MRRLGLTALVVCVALGCAPGAPPAAVAPAPIPGPRPEVSVVAKTEPAPPPVETAPPPPPLPPPPKVILHAGDSMVGGPGGLAQALDVKFSQFGTKYVRDWRVATVQTFDYHDYFGKLLRANKPDLVILNLGANDVFVPSPRALAGYVAAIAKKASEGGRRCYWITPPLWKPPDTGIVRVIKESAVGCKVFDSSDLALPKWPDGIHPNNEGGKIWADAFWEFYSKP